MEQSHAEVGTQPTATELGYSNLRYLAVGLRRGAADVGGSGNGRGHSGLRCVPRKRSEPRRLAGGLWGRPARQCSSPVTAITELSLRGQPSIETGPKFRAARQDSCKEREFG